jgi:peptide/nickel transport system ATP-binding protein
MTDTAAMDTHVLNRPALEVTDLGVATRSTGKILLDSLSLQVKKGQTLGIIGESGSGKSTALLAIAGILPDTLERSSGTVKIRIENSDDGQDHEQFAGDNPSPEDIGYVFQNPGTRLNHRLRIISHLREAMSPDNRSSRHAAALLTEVGIPDPWRVLNSYPSELSGGLAQRVMVAIAIARNPRVLLADEPTTALDTTIQAQVLRLIDDLKRRRGLAVILVSHDVDVVAANCDTVVVLREGREIERGTTADVLASPQTAYTRELVDAHKPLDIGEPPAASQHPPKISATGLVKTYGAHASFRRHRESPGTAALNDVSIELTAGSSLGIVGESGSGKTTLGKILAGLQPPDAGTIAINGKTLDPTDRRDRLRIQRHVQYMNQDAYGSLDPRVSPLTLVTRILARHVSQENVGGNTQRAEDLLHDVGLSDDLAARSPSSLSGGQRQRVVLARALAAHPQFVVADEPTSALDVVVQRRLLSLLTNLRHDIGLGLIMISHDLKVIRDTCQHVIVVKDGQVVESGETSAVFSDPSHWYTALLVDAAPQFVGTTSIRRKESIR